MTKDLFNVVAQTELAAQIKPDKPLKPSEKPLNGLKGLKHWRTDMLAGLLVALISTPFSIGIAVASGAPPITGLTSAIIAGLVLPFIGGSYVTISGPAAGLAPILFSAILTLGAGNKEEGYLLLLPIITIAGFVQLLMSHFKAARFSAILPAPVVEGMLAAIGLMIIAKQLPTLLGLKFTHHEFWTIIGEFSQKAMNANTTVLGLGLATLTVIFLLDRLGKGTTWAKVCPPMIIAVLLCSLAAQAFTLENQFFITLPSNPLHGIVLPDFIGLAQHPELWWSAIGIVITLALVDGIESLATIKAVDKIDPYKRTSKPDKTLFAMGVSNICSSLMGGLTIIPGGVKSTANIMAGGKTQWANFYNACFIAIFLLAFKDIIALIPLSVLSAVLIWTGFKLCKPSVWQKIYSIGIDQFLLFTITIAITLTTDLLWGIVGGIIAALIKNAFFIFRTNANQPEKSLLTDLTVSMFRSPISNRLWVGEEYHVFLNRSVVCSNYLHIEKIINELPQNATKINFYFLPGVLMADHTSLENLEQTIERYNNDHQVPIELIGLDGFRKLSNNKLATRTLEIEYEQMVAAG